jgi:hypothetical protein
VPFWRPAELFHWIGSHSRPDGVSARLPLTVMRTHIGMGAHYIILGLSDVKKQTEFSFHNNDAKSETKSSLQSIAIKILIHINS